jgi:sialate O-acetylesterase
MEDLDYFQIKSFSVNGQTAEELIALVKQAEKNHSLLVFLLHGVGGEHTLNISLEEHNKLLQYLKDHEASVWVSPLVEILEYVQSKPSFRQGSPARPQG